MRKSIIFISILLLSLLLVVSCTNNTQGAKAVGLFADRVGQVFADDAWSYDVVYKDSSSRYLSEVTVNLSNGSYRYPSSVKAEILKKNGESWETYLKDVTGKVTFKESGIYKVKYSAEGMTVETEEFKVYKPGEIYDFTANKSVYVEGTQMQKTDFSFTYCYKTEDGDIGLTNSYEKAYDIWIYTRDEDVTFFSLLNSEFDQYKYADKTYGGVIIQFNEGDEVWASQEVEIKVVKQSDCDVVIKNFAYFSKIKNTTEYEFSGYIYKVFYYEGRPMGKTYILRKTDSGVEITDGYTLKISDYVPSTVATTDSANLLTLYKGVETWNDITSDTFDKKTITGPGYYFIQVYEGSTLYNEEEPAYIRVSK